MLASDNLSNDYVPKIMFFEKTMHGQASARLLYWGSWVNQHFTLFPSILIAALARLSGWSIFPEMYAGLCMFIVRLALTVDMLAAGRSVLGRLFLLAVLSALVLSPTQSTTLTFGIDALELGLTTLFGTLSLWVLFRLPRSTIAVVLATTGGLIASWSWGAGLLIWPLMLVAIIIRGYRNLRDYVVWFGMMVVSAVPYLARLFAAGRGSFLPTGRGPLDVEFATRMIGAVLAVQTPGYLSPGVLGTGVLGILMFAFLVSALISKRRDKGTLRRAYPAILLVLWGILASWQITLGRQQIAAWYLSITVEFWIGLVGLSAAMFSLSDLRRSLQGNPLRKLTSVLLPGAVLLGVLILYINSNVISRPSSFFLSSEAPVSAECLRRGTAAPTYCEGSLFQYRLGNPDYIAHLAFPLETYHQSVFGQRQTWTLQGSFLLESVDTAIRSRSPPSWWTGLDGIESSYTDYRHLDLMLPAPSSVSWTVRLPPSLTSATLRTAIGLHSHLPVSGSERPVTFRIDVLVPGEAAAALYEASLDTDARGWRETILPLQDYAGRTITLRFSTLAGDSAAGRWAMFRYPSIDVRMSGYTDSTSNSRRYRPENTELSPDFPTISSNDLLLDSSNADIWRRVGLDPVPNRKDALAPAKRGDVYLEWRPLHGISLTDYSHIVLRLGLSRNLRPRVLKLVVYVDDDPTYVVIPLLPDGALHSYSYPLRLLGLERNRQLTALRLYPVHGRVFRRSFIRFGGARLICATTAVPGCPQP